MGTVDRADDRTFNVNFTSDGVKKLREAVKEKLMEFTDFSDDHLVVWACFISCLFGFYARRETLYVQWLSIYALSFVFQGLFNYGCWFVLGQGCWAVAFGLHMLSLHVVRSGLIHLVAVDTMDWLKWTVTHFTFLDNIRMLCKSLEQVMATKCELLNLWEL